MGQIPVSSNIRRNWDLTRMADLQDHPQWRGCEGLAELTLNCGMQEEAHTRTWEALYMVQSVRKRA